MYRPEGYQEILARTMGAIAPIDAKLVEAGADAYEEALKNGIPDGDGGTYRLTHYLKPVRAKFETAFIEEE